MQKLACVVVLLSCASATCIEKCGLTSGSFHHGVSYPFHHGLGHHPIPMTCANLDGPFSHGIPQIDLSENGTTTSIEFWGNHVDEIQTMDEESRSEVELDTTSTVIFERRVTIPRTSDMFTLDIIHDFDMFIEIHESTKDTELVSFSLEMEGMGDNTAIPEFSINYKVMSLGSETEVLLTLSHATNSKDEGNNFLMLLSTVMIVIIISAIINNNKQDKTTKLPCASPPAAGTGENRHEKLPQQSKLDSCEFLVDSVTHCRECEPDGRLQKARAVTYDSENILVNGQPDKALDIDKASATQLNFLKQDGSSQRSETQETEVQNAPITSFKSPSLTAMSTDHRKSVMTQNSQMSPSSTCLCRQQQQQTQQQHNDAHNTLYLKFVSRDIDDKNDSSHAHVPSLQRIRSKFRLRSVAFVLFSTLVLVAVAMGVSRLRVKPTLHVTFPASNVIRKVRMFSDYPDLTQLSRNHSSLSLLSRLQLLDTQRCKDDLKTCKISVVCDSSTDQSINCRCRHGFYFKDWKCHACSTQCPADHFLASSCSVNSDAVCKPCTVCTQTQYEAAQCNTHRDTICVDVSFPVGILPLNKSHLPDDGIEIRVSHSSNVFLERLVDMEALETPMYVTNNQQSLDFVWPRLSGLDIAVSVSGVFLVPDYRDVDAVDDTALFHRLQDPSQTAKNYYNLVQNNYCRHPIPDYYALQLEIIANRSSAAQVIRCDSQDDSVPRCPGHYKDGDRYLQWDINKPCASFPSSKFQSLTNRPNSVVCTDETEVLRKVFGGTRPTTQEWMFPTVECEKQRHLCQQCLNTAKCPAGTSSNDKNASYLGEDNQCCGIPCYSQASCQKAYSPECPQPTVECATGEVNIFSLFPNFETMERQFACHLMYEPPEHLYSISYTVRAPSINFNMTPQHFTVTPNSRGDHQRRLSNFDFISAQHDTRLKVEEELILLGDHMELEYHSDSLMKPYTIRELKTPDDLSKQQMFTQNYLHKSSYIQFERPFLYSSLTWDKDGCHKNMSQIYPNQTIYKEDFIPVMARKNVLDSESDGTSYEHPGYSYQLYHRDRAPYVKFYVEKGKSVLQHLQGTIVTGKLVPNSLYGRVSWHHETSTWKLVFSGQQDECPTVISLKIFTQLMTGCAGHFDLLINCPQDFTVTFNFSTGMSDLPDIFILQVNDSATSHNMVLSSVYSPIYVDEIKGKAPGQVREKMSASDEDNNLLHIWTPIIVIVIHTLIILFLIFICYKCINSRVRVAIVKEGEAVALNNQGEKFNQNVTASGAKPRPRCSICVFVILYVVYCLVFTFSLTFGIIYVTHTSVWANLTHPENLGTELHVQVNKSLLEIRKFEETERLRLFEAYETRRKACIYHLENENRKLLLDYETTTQKQVDAIFVENGTLHYFTNEIQRQNVSAYMQQIQNFVSDCNKTLHAIVDRFQANYFQFLRNTALNDWLKVPRQIFLYQDGEDPDRKFLSSTQVKQFASWLEVDKTEELLAARENVFGRLSSIPLPKVSTLDVTFPSVEPHLSFGLPDFDFDVYSYLYTVLDPLFNKDDTTANSSLESSTASTGRRRYRRYRRDVESFGLSGNLKHNPDREDFSDMDVDRNTAGNDEADFTDDVRSSFEGDASYKTAVMPEKLSTDEANGDAVGDEDSNPFETIDTNVVSIEENEDSLSNVIKDHPLKAEALTSSSSSSLKDKNLNSESNKWMYILIVVFIILDFVLLAYRISWLTNQLYAARHGYADRIPTDEACKQVLEIQTAYHIPAFENPHDESSGYYVDGKEQLYTSERETDMTFLQSLPKTKDDNNILHKIWNEKMNKAEDRTEVRMRKCFLVRWYDDLRTILNRLFLSPLVWQGSITFLAISFICVFVYSMEFWLTADNFRTLVGGQSAAADVQWHLDTSDRYLHSLAQQLTIELQHMKELCDSEVEVLTDMFFTTVNMQTSIFTSTLQRLCWEAKGKNCDKIMAHQSTGGRIVGCNFLPLQARTFHDLSLTHMEAVVAREVTPLMRLSHRMLAVSASLIVFLLCFRLLCQAAATTVRHYLLLTGRLPRVRVYQSEEPQANGGPNSTIMQRSQSWVDSCESGVYLGEADDTNKEENR